MKTSRNCSSSSPATARVLFSALLLHWWFGLFGCHHPAVLLVHANGKENNFNSIPIATDDLLCPAEAQTILSFYSMEIFVASEANHCNQEQQEEVSHILSEILYDAFEGIPGLVSVKASICPLPQQPQNGGEDQDDEEEGNGSGVRRRIRAIQPTDGRRKVKDHLSPTITKGNRFLPLELENHSAVDPQTSRELRPVFVYLGGMACRFCKLDDLDARQQLLDSLSFPTKTRTLLFLNSGNGRQLSKLSEEEKIIFKRKRKARKKAKRQCRQSWEQLFGSRKTLPWEDVIENKRIMMYKGRTVLGPYVFGVTLTRTLLVPPGATKLKLTFGIYQNQIGPHWDEDNGDSVIVEIVKNGDEKSRLILPYFEKQTVYYQRGSWVSAALNFKHKGSGKLVLTKVALHMNMATRHIDLTRNQTLVLKLTSNATITTEQTIGEDLDEDYGDVTQLDDGGDDADDFNNTLDGVGFDDVNDGDDVDDLDEVLDDIDEEAYDEEKLVAYGRMRFLGGYSCAKTLPDRSMYSEEELNAMPLEERMELKLSQQLTEKFRSAVAKDKRNCHHGTKPTVYVNLYEQKTQEATRPECVASIMHR